MSYRTYVEGVQIFGNNECYPEWIEFVKSQGITVDEEGCYSGEIKDFMGALSVIETIVLRKNKEREEFKMEYNGNMAGKPILSLFDFTNTPNVLERQSPNDRYNNSLLDELMTIIDTSYAFMPYAFYLACEDKLEPDKVFSTEGHFYCYKLKEGLTLDVEAH